MEAEERQALLALPAKRWEPAIWKKATLHRDSHVQIDGAFYSAPWRLLMAELWVRTTPHRIAIYLADEHLWTHPRVPRGKRSTVEAHRPAARSRFPRRLPAPA